MGWTTEPGMNLHSLVQRFIRGEATDRHSIADYATHRESIDEVHVWLVIEVLGEAKAMIGAVILKRSPSGWAYKPMDGDMGPCYYSCPHTLIKKALQLGWVPKGFGLDWLKRCGYPHSEVARSV